MTRKSPVLYLLVSLLAYFGLWIGVPRARFMSAIGTSIESAMRHAHQPLATILPILGIIVFTIPTIAFMAAQIAVVYFFTKTRWGFKGGLLWLVACLIGLTAMVALMVSRIGFVDKIHRMPNIPEIISIVGLFQPSLLGMLMSGVILLTGASIGYLVSLRIKDKNLLVPVVMFAASIDFWTVTQGPVSSMMEKLPEITNAISTPIPQAGTGSFVPLVMMGIGDPLFMAVVFAAVHRLGMNGRRNFWFVFVIMTLAMLLVLVGLVPYLPALVALAIAVVAANWREIRLSKQEKISVAIVGVVLVLSVFAIGNAFGPTEAAKKKPVPPTTAPVSSPHSPATSK